MQTVQTAPGPALGHVGYLDGWRGLAIVLLLIGHFFPVPGINFGTVGVNLFFALSGWLMAGLLFVKREPLPKFYRRRIARIVPALAVFIGLVVVALALMGRPISGRETWAALFFVNNYVAPAAGPGTAVMPFGHIWSLAVEEHSYVVLSLVALAVRRWGLSAAVAVAGLLLASVGFAAYYQWLNPPQLAFRQWLHSEVAAFGLLAAALWVALGWRPARHAALALCVPVLMAAGLMLHWWSVPLFVQRVGGVGCLVLALCLLTVTEGRVAAVLAWRPLRQLGLWSYSLYLWQQPFYLWSHDGSAASRLAALGLAGACGLLSFYLVERPARDHLNRHWGRPAALAGLEPEPRR